MDEIQAEYASLEAAKADHMGVLLGTGARPTTHPLLLAPRRSPDLLPTWTAGPLQITPGPVCPPGPGGGEHVQFKEVLLILCVCVCVCVWFRHHIEISNADIIWR